MKMSDAEINAVCDALFNDDYNDDWFERAGRESSRETLLALIEKAIHYVELLVSWTTFYAM